jgi:hypothetical protein
MGDHSGLSVETGERVPLRVFIMCSSRFTGRLWLAGLVVLSIVRIGLVSRLQMSNFSCALHQQTSTEEAAEEAG